MTLRKNRLNSLDISSVISISHLRAAFATKEILPDFRSIFVPADKNVPGLDVARAFAVLLVICDHFKFGWEQTGRASVDWFSLPFVHWGWTGVDLFFVLSGCLIGLQLWRELQSTGTVKWTAFFLRRGFRIWPLYFGWLAFLTLTASPSTPRWYDWLLMSNYSMGAGFSRSWSLSTEEHFYLLIPALFIVAGRVLRPACVAVLIGGIACSIPLLRWITATRLQDIGLTTRQISDRMYEPFHLHSEALFVGLLLAFLYFNVVRLRPSRGLTIAAFLVPAAVLGVVLRQFDRVIFAYIALALVYGTFVWLLWISSGASLIQLAGRLMHPIARLSFGMYLNHLMIPGSLVRYQKLAFGLTQSDSFAAAIALALVCIESAIIATLTYVLIEQPFLRLRTSYVKAAH